MNIEEIKAIIASGNAEEIAHCIKQNGLSLVDNKIIFNKEKLSNLYEFYDKRQLVRKILLNSALTSSAFVQ